MLALCLLALAALAAAQVLLARRTNRVINVGLAVATVAALTSLGWSTIALTGAGGHLDDGRERGSTQVHVLAEARVAALQARADEALTLVARGDGAAFEKDFVATVERLAGADGASGLLGQALAGASDDRDRQLIQEAIDQARRWVALHKEVRGLDDGGQYLDAVKRATDPGAQGLPATFGHVDDALTRGLAAANDRFDAAADDADGALRGADIAIIVLTLLLVAAAVVGLQRRIGEYR
ncbi:hypothetical protein ACFQX7_40175 [Luedemannella flava]